MGFIKTKLLPFAIVSLFGVAFFAVSAINFETFRDTDLSLFEAIEPNIVSLDLSGSAITDSIFLALKKFSNLTTLKLNNTQITGKELDQIVTLQNLKRLYLINTSFDEKFIETLSKEISLYFF